MYIKFPTVYQSTFFCFVYCNNEEKLFISLNDEVTGLENTCQNLYLATDVTESIEEC